MQDVWSKNENEDIDRAIALSLLEENQKGSSVNGEWYYSSQILLHILDRTTCIPVHLFESLQSEGHVATD